MVSLKSGIAYFNQFDSSNDLGFGRYGQHPLLQNSHKDFAVTINVQAVCDSQGTRLGTLTEEGLYNVVCISARAQLVVLFFFLRMNGAHKRYKTQFTKL